MDGRVDMIIDGGECDIGLESTIVKIDGNRLILLRPGAVTYDALSCVCEGVTVADAVIGSLAENERPLSPGMKYRHYAPNSPFVLITGEDDKVIEFMKKASSTENCAFLCYDEEITLLNCKKAIPIGAKNDLAHQAKVLFTSLRNADKFGADIIYAHLPPLDGLGLALYNRMIRAAAHTIKEV